MITVFYKRVNWKYVDCSGCGKTGVKYVVVRVVTDKWSYVAGHNMDARYYCSMECMKRGERGDEYIRVKKNTIAEINAMGYRA